MDILKHVTKKGVKDGYTIFEITPSKAYKAMQEYAQGLIENDTPMGDIPNRERRYYSELKANTKGLNLVNTPHSAVTKKADIEDRANALETLRHWFTYLIKKANGSAVGIKILKDEDYKL